MTAACEADASASSTGFREPCSSITLAPMAAELDDGALMLKYRAGDVAAFELLYRRHKAPLYRYLVRHTADREAGNDLFQEVWSRVIASRDRYEPRARFAGFLYRIAHNAVADYYRRRKRRHEERSNSLDDLTDTLHDADCAGPEGIAQGAEAAAALRRAIAALPAEQRDVFLLYEETGLALDDIARITAVGAETVKSRLRYALAKLRRRLGEEGTGRGAGR